MARGLVLAMGGATIALVACGTALDNSYPDDAQYSGNVAASYLDYPESDMSLVASEVDAAAEGFALGGGNATVLMNDMTCGVHIDSGTVFFDVDLGLGEIQDGLDVDGSSGGGGHELTSLLVAPPLVHLVPVEHPTSAARFLVRGVREARLLDDQGFVSLSAMEDDTCALRWYEEGRMVQSLELAEASCVGELGFAVDRDSGVAWIATPDGVFHIDQEQVVRLPVEGDLLAWDASTAQLYVGSHGSNTVSAVRGERVLWTLDLPGEVMDLDDGGARGGLVIAHKEGLGYSVDRFDADGSVIDHLAFDRPVLDVSISDGGDQMGIARVDDHAYYRLQ